MHKKKWTKKTLEVFKVSMFPGSVMWVCKKVAAFLFHYMDSVVDGIQSATL